MCCRRMTLLLTKSGEAGLSNCVQSQEQLRLLVTVLAVSDIYLEFFMLYFNNCMFHVYDFILHFNSKAEKKCILFTFHSVGAASSSVCVCNCTVFMPVMSRGIIPLRLCHIIFINAVSTATATFGLYHFHVLHMLCRQLLNFSNNSICSRICITMTREIVKNSLTIFFRHLSSPLCLWSLPK